MALVGLLPRKLEESCIPDGTVVQNANISPLLRPEIQVGHSTVYLRSWFSSPMTGDREENYGEDDQSCRSPHDT